MLKVLRREPGFYRRLVLLALPLVLQNLVTTSLGFVDTFMVGMLGSNELSAVTAANTPVFLVQCCIFGLMSGLSVLATQYWGHQDTVSINRVMGVVLYIGITLTVSASAVLFFFSEQVMSLVTDNPLLIELGAPYLEIVGFGYVFNTISCVYVSVQRSTENPSFGMKVFCTSMLLNTFLNYVFIFGNFGAPRMGVAGAALATTFARISEVVIVSVHAIRNRRVPVMPKVILRPGVDMLRRTVRYSGPVMLNEMLWGTGTSTITAIMGHMAISADMLAAHAIMGNIDKFATVACFGLANAAAVMVGKRIGEGNSKDDVYQLAMCLLTVCLLVGSAVAVLMAILLPTVFIPFVYPLFQLTEQATRIAVTLCIVYLIVMPLRFFDITNIVGVLRSGGDTKMAAILDLLPLWLASIPCMALFALVLDAPIPLICAATQFESLIKTPLGLVRLRSRKWINDVTVGGIE